MTNRGMVLTMFTLGNQGIYLASLQSLWERVLTRVWAPLPQLATSEALPQLK